MEGIIFKDDVRYRYTEEYLTKRNCLFHEPGCSYMPEILDFIIFPFKKDIDTTLFDDGYFSSLRHDVKIFSGVRNSYLEEKCLNHSFDYHIMMEDEGVAQKNAIPTSEGVISYLIANSTVTVHGSRILIIGYGICGRDMAIRLNALGAVVYALVRNSVKECRARGDLVNPIYIDDDDMHKIGFDAVINTVPGRVLSDKTIDSLGAALFIDIASSPYGFDMERVKKLNEKSALLQGIPGKYAVRSAGEILGEYIRNILKA